MMKAEKELTSGNHVTIFLQVEKGETTMTTVYATPPSEGDKKEVDGFRNEAARRMGMEMIRP
jgi:hypothetical protein